MAPTFKVLIAGAGLGGITLAILLEKAQIDYDLFESSPQVSPLGSAIVLGPSIFPLLEQLGLLDKVDKISKPVQTIHLVQDNLKRIGELDLSDHKDRTGYASRVSTRTDLLSLLISQLDPKRVHFSKQIVSFSQNKDSAEIRCADHTTYKGDILVGSDGAFSRIRTCLYKQVAKKGILPRHDAALFSALPSIADNGGLEEGVFQPTGSHFSLVGVTDPLDRNRYPGLQDAESRCDTIVVDHITFGYYTLPGDRIAWTVHMHLEDPALREHYAQPQQLQRPPSPTPSTMSYASSSTTASYASTVSYIPGGWEPEEKVKGLATVGELLSEEYQHLKLPIGGLFRDLMNATPPQSVTRTVSEEFLCETWHHGRTVLIGDACHGLLPNAGQGAASAMLDSVILANLLHDLPSASPEHVVELFKAFQADRLPFAKVQMDLSHRVNKVLLSSPTSPSSPLGSGPFGSSVLSSSPPTSSSPPSGHGSWTDSWMRKLMVRYLSKVYQHFSDAKTLADRPQAAFLPLIPNRGSTAPLPQRTPKVYSASTASGTKH
ncbi:hypothetical protein EMPS_10461 [Entomortierella parvispora]|uniref:FAD-binding domain-containing protein n=1 Tax=Entomortierella parvispora TaxID=205924 RepID=A0A9P3HK25_9FUNG|nr:hypothetical protein EMPS_10461 [Entomortierella parvispora]